MVALTDAEGKRAKTSGQHNQHDCRRMSRFYVIVPHPKRASAFAARRRLAPGELLF
jgi:hypothetical protein